MNPGGVLDIRGVEFDYEELVTLYLERQGIVVSLGEINADLEGIFIHKFSPKDVVRHRMVGRMLTAYEKLEASERAAKPAAPEPNGP